MGLLEVKNLRFKYADKELFNDVEFRVFNHDHIVIVGDNGAGKSTFMNLICKNLIPDKGEIVWLPNTKFGYLDQHLKVKTDITIIEYLEEVFKPLIEKEKKMNEYYDMLGTCKEYEYDKYLNYANAIQEELEKANFYAMNSTLGNMTNGLGITGFGLDTKLKELSGGQREKVYLAKLLLQNPDVLLMDEPTNFLDQAQIEWLKSYLNGYNKSFVVISHDEDFIRSIAKTVYNLSNNVMTRYNMDYDHYLLEKEIRDDNYLKAYNKQQEYIKRTEEFINKNIVRATTTKRAQSRRKLLDRLDRIEKPKNHEPMHIKFPYSGQLGQEVLVLNDLTVGYNNKPVLEHLNFLLGQNQKVVILGHNGVGKSTILKTILDIIKPISGNYKWNPSGVINYFKQEEEYKKEETPISYLRYFYHLKTDQELRSILAQVGLKGDIVTKPMNTLSGGEQTKVRLALMTMKKSNILVFDEPTNHLDMASKGELYEAISEFPGSVILVTHEDDFYDGLVDLELKFN